MDTVKGNQISSGRRDKLKFSPDGVTFTQTNGSLICDACGADYTDIAKMLGSRSSIKAVHIAAHARTIMDSWYSEIGSSKYEWRVVLQAINASLALASGQGEDL